MLIKALCDYADKLEESGTDKIPDGWSPESISYRIMLNPDGSISDIVDVRIQETIPLKNDKTKTVFKPRGVILPKRTQRTCIDSNIIEHRPLYIFGLNYDKSGLTPNDKTNKAKKSHDDFVKKNSAVFEGLASEMCCAYYRFINSWNPENEITNEKLTGLGKNLSDAKFGFGLAGGKGNLEDDEEFKAKYSELLAETSDAEASDNADLATCAITGQKMPIARIHDKIKFPGGNSTGCVLVGMKETAYESYGKTQSYNSNISETAMKKYTSALNKLLSDKKHRVIIDDMVIVYFAMKHDDNAECGLLSVLLGSSDEKAQTILDTVYEGVKRGSVDISTFGADPNVTFYVVGLTPNSSRICQKFIYKDRFGHIIENLLIHQKDLMINPDSDRQVYFSSIAKELVSPKSTNEKVPPPLMSGIMMSAFKGTNYPCSLLASVIRRVKTDQDEEKNHFIKLNDTRAGIIKACINRKLRNSGQKEEIIMAWDENNLNPSYLCGGLFAVYEKIQKESAGGDLNRTIKDSYFASACSRPSVIMPKLAKLSQNHLRKLEDGSRKRYNNLIIELMNGFNSDFPKTQDLDSQGRFIIGYYQMQKKLYTPKSENK